MNRQEGKELFFHFVNVEDDRWKTGAQELSSAT